MNNIHRVINGDVIDSMSKEELQAYASTCEDMASGIVASLSVMGNALFWATANENYPPNDAVRDLQNVSEALLYLPSLAECLSGNAIDARFLLRKGGEA
ncbi:hypothetical protein [Aeromonas enteropelogenes]|uniref:hypothetical protein n=1 Tax=Aeromonas enteropelogenes TaxID=29489 RepID=UPI003BA00284